MGEKKIRGKNKKIIIGLAILIVILGVIIKITPSKVPRLIGKQGSMVTLIKEKTGTIIRVGQNGLVWVSGENVDKAIKAIKTIEQKSHIFGLTEEISKLLS